MVDDAASLDCLKRNAADVEEPLIASTNQIPPTTHQTPPSPSPTQTHLAEALLPESFQEDCHTAAALPPTNQSDLITSNKGGGVRGRKRSEEGRSLGKVEVGTTKQKAGSAPAKHRKQSGIPVGIAVAWQRHVTSSASASPHTNTSSYAASKHHTHLSAPAMSSPPLKAKRSLVCPKVAPTVTAVQGSEVKNGHEGSHKVKKSGGLKSPGPPGHGTKKHGSGSGDSASESVKCEPDRGGGSSNSETVGGQGSSDLERVMPPYKSSNSYFPYAYNNPYGDWTSHSQYFVPNSTQQSYNAMMAAYIQQLSMQHQSLPHGYGPLSSSYLYAGDGGSAYSPEQLLQYERLLLQRQQEQFERSQAEQRRLLTEYDLRHGGGGGGGSMPALSPRISIPSPSPNSPQGPYGTPYPAHQQPATTPTVPWMTSDLYHHHHPMTLISSATLSPRSLASSTPSPITTYESLTHSYLYNRKCITPNPIKYPPGSLFSPPLCGPKDSGPVSLVTHGRAASASLAEFDDREPNGGDSASVKGEFGGAESLEEEASLGNPVTQMEEEPCTVESITVKPEKATSVDFTRLESLIEKRGEDQFAHAPLPPCRKKRKRDSWAERELLKPKAEAPCRRGHHRDCNGNETKVPEESSGVEGLPKSPETINLRAKDEGNYFLPIGNCGDEADFLGSRSGDQEAESLIDAADADASTSVPLHSSDNTLSDLVCDSEKGGATNWPLDGACGSNVSGNSSCLATAPFQNSGCLATASFANCTTLAPPFPKIVIPSGESHLNLLATVAQEIGPYISLLPNQSSTSPRRFEAVDVDQLITIQNVLAESAGAGRSPSIDTGSIKAEDATSISPGDDSARQNSNERELTPVKAEAFQLKIPRIVPRITATTVKSKLKIKSEKKEKSKKRAKKEHKKSLTEPKTALPEPKVKGRTEPSSAKKTVPRCPTVRDQDKGTEGGKPLESIYDFEADDILPPHLESFKHFSAAGGDVTVEGESGKKQQFSMLSPLFAAKKKQRCEGPPTGTLKGQDLKAPKKYAIPIARQKKLLAKGLLQQNAGPASLSIRPESANSEPEVVRKVNRAEQVNDTVTLGTKTDTVTAGPKHGNTATVGVSRAVESLLSADNSNGSLSTDSCSSTWTANPALAVTAVKLPPKAGSKVKVRSKTGEKVKVGKKCAKSGKSVPGSDGGKVGLESIPIWDKFPAISRKKGGSSPHHIKPSLKAEPIRIREGSKSVDDEEGLDDELFLDVTGDSAVSGSEAAIPRTERLKIRKPSIDMNIFSRRVQSEVEKKAGPVAGWTENVVIRSVEEMLDEMRVLTEIEGLFYTGKLNALQPPDVYGVTLDNERGAPPHIIFSAEEVLEKCIREAKPWEPSQLPHGLRICAYWSPMYSGLYPGHVSTDYDLTSDLVPVEFDDGDTGVIKICEIRLLAPDHPMREYDPNPLLTLEKKHRKRRHSSAGGSGGACTGEHDEDDCGEAYCAKIAKMEEREEEFSADSASNRFKYWTWTGLGVKQSKTKENRHKEFYRGIQRGEEVINVGDSAIFISDQQNRRPFLGRVENFWEKKGLKSVTVRWFYHPEEAKTNKKMPQLKYPGAVFESPHTDVNDVQTIAKKCEVLSLKDFKAKYGSLFSGKKGHKGSQGVKGSAPKGVYYIAGYYDPYAQQLKMKDLK